MDIDLAADTVRGDDHETILFAWLLPGGRVLTNGCARDWRSILSADEVGLFLRAASINPLEPVVDCDDCPVWPGISEERTVRDFLYPDVDRRRSILRLMRPPSPAHHVLEVEEGKPR